MAKSYKFEKQQISNKWYTVCISHEHVPMIRHNSDGTYTVKGVDGKPRTEKEFKKAMKFAIETFKRMSKFNQEWETQSI